MLPIAGPQAHPDSRRLWGGFLVSRWGPQPRRYNSTASTRLESVASVGRSSFVKTLDTFFSTERRLMWHCSAMPWLDRPSAIKARTSRSRAVRRDRRSPWRRFMINSDTICGSIADPPSATRRTDSTKSRTLRILSFNR
jgi:hypothetical protein